jgi:hypothetical protein
MRKSETVAFDTVSLNDNSCEVLDVIRLAVYDYRKAFGLRAFIEAMQRIYCNGNRAATSAFESESSKTEFPVGFAQNWYFGINTSWIL